MNKLNFVVTACICSTLLLSSCSTHATAQESSVTPTHQSKKTQRATIHATGYFITVGEKTVFCSGAKLSQNYDEAQLRAHFQNGIQLTESKALDTHNPLSVYVISPAPRQAPQFAYVRITVVQPNVQVSTTQKMTVDLADTAGIPELRIKTYAILR